MWLPGYFYSSVGVQICELDDVLCAVVDDKYSLRGERNLNSVPGHQGCLRPYMPCRFHSVFNIVEPLPHHFANIKQDTGSVTGIELVNRAVDAWIFPEETLPARDEESDMPLYPA